MNAHPPPPTADDSALRDEVLDWCVCRGREDWGAAHERRFQAWLAGDAARSAALAEWEAQWKALDGIPADALAALRGRLAVDKAREAAAGAPQGLPPVNARRRGLLPAFATAAVLMAAGCSAFLAWNHWQAQPVYAQAFSTPRGQQVDALLPDGTHLRLDTATRLEVTYYRQRREVRLVEGQALFSVQRDPARPFQVLAGPVGVTVVGTRFTVRHTPTLPGAAGVRVAVEEGQVRVARLDSAPGAPAAEVALHLTAGQQVQADARGVPGPITAVSSEGIAPWRANRVSFVDTPLNEALAELERYGSTRLVVRDPATAALRLTGTFDPRDAATLRRVLPSALPVRLQASGGLSSGLIEIMPAR